MQTNISPHGAVTQAQQNSIMRFDGTIGILGGTGHSRFIRSTGVGTQ